jgi:hypothetical protein
LLVSGWWTSPSHTTSCNMDKQFYWVHLKCRYVSILFSNPGSHASKVRVAHCSRQVVHKVLISASRLVFPALARSSLQLQCIDFGFFD